METTFNQYLTFTLDGERYAINVGKVREVLEYTKITKIPRSAPYMRGLINLRGSGVPVVDLRARFGLESVEPDSRTSIIVVEVRVASRDTLVLGALADSVQEVIELEPGQIEAAPRFGTRLATEFIQGMGKQDDSFIVILDIDKIFSSEEASLLSRPEVTALAASLVSDGAGGGSAGATAGQSGASPASVPLEAALGREEASCCAAPPSA
jgi:purine-binding chemotaxis protein CheW